MDANVRPLAQRLDLANRLAPYAPHRWTDNGKSGLPTLYLDDVSAIPFLINISSVEEYQHRARVRAGAGDLFATVTPLTDGYEAYCRERLQLGAPELIVAEPVDNLLAVGKACAEGAAFARLAQRTREAGGLLIHPYMGIESIWQLAAKLTAETGAPVQVIAPPPPVTWIANDKSLFTEMVRLTLGEDSVVETHESNDPAQLALLLLGLRQRHARVGLKRLRCASAMGNQIFDDLSEAGAESQVRAFLERTEWDGAETVQAVAWEQTDLSPSTQLWIPPEGAGPPRLDGIYEQILEGHGVFVGSRPSTLPEPCNAAIARAAITVAEGFQRLGYVGRCSFDFLILGDAQGEFSVRLTECNGRWGGTSTPMRLLDRISNGPRPPYRAQDIVQDALVGRRFSDLLAQVGERAHDPETGQGTFIFYNVGPLEPSGKLDVIAIGQTQEDAERAMTEELPGLLGL